MSDMTSRITGLRTSLGVKAPVRTATTANIALTGFQTISGITLAAADTNLRVLVKDQTDPVENGIWDAKATAWTRAKDFNGNDDIVTGSGVFVAEGSYAYHWFLVSTANPIVIGTSAINFVDGSIVILEDNLCGNVDTVAELRALDAGAFNSVVVGGYYAIGDNGGGTFYWSAASASAHNGGTIISPLSAPATGRWIRNGTREYNIREFGAVGSGVVSDPSTDDRAFIQAAIDACPAGGTVRIPLGKFCVAQGAGAYCLNVVNPINIVGEGQFSAITPLNTVSSSIDTIRLAPTIGAFDWTATRYQDFCLGDYATGTRNGRYGIFIDTLTAGMQLRKPRFVGCIIFMSSGTGQAIRHDNVVAGLNVNGGMYGALIDDCILGGGISLNASGDSNVIHKCIISGANIGIYANLVAGASLLDIDDNNITSTGGAITLDGGPRFRITNNNCEQTVTQTGGGNNAMIDIIGGGSTLSTGLISGNHLGAFSGTGITANVRLRNCINVLVERNVMLPAAVGQFAIDIATSSGTQIDRNTYGTGFTAPFVTDTAPASTVTSSIAPTVLGGNSASGSAAGATSYFMNVLSATETSVYWAAPVAGVLRNLYIATGAAPGGGQTYTLTVRKTLADTALTCTISGAGSNTGSDSTNEVSVALGDRICIKVVSSGGAANTGIIAWGMTFEPIATVQSDL